MTNLNSDSVNLGSSPSPPTKKTAENKAFFYVCERNERAERDERWHKKSTDDFPEDTSYYDESGWRHRIDGGDLALIAPDSDRGLYILLAIILIGSTALFGVSGYMLLG